MVLRRLYTWEFKEDIVEKATQPGVHPANVAREAGINSGLVQRWIKEKAAGAWDGHPAGAALNLPKKYNKKQLPTEIQRAPSASSASNDQVDKLQRKLDFLAKENDLLRKMVALYITLQP